MRRQVEGALAALRSRERGPVFAPTDRRMVMAYPSPYRVGMSSLGFQRVTTLLREAGIAAERCFLPDEPDKLRAGRVPPLTVESLTSIAQFPLIAVSFAYEAELIGLMDLLDLAGIPPLRADRTADHPRILVGGPISMADPSFLAPFVDAMLLGEAEDTIVPGVDAGLDLEREAWLDRIEALPGGWVPERGQPIPPIAKASDAHLPARSAWLTPDTELADMFLVEGERGCHRMCTFCVMRRTTNGGMRLVTPERVLGLVPDHAHKVGLVGAAISDHPNLVELLDTLVGSGRQVSVSSLRADRLVKKPRIAELLRQSGARTLTTASDGATDALRKGMSKGTTREHLVGCAELARSLGYGTLKLYMMLGVPGEQDADVDVLADELRELARAAAPARVALGVAAFVAKRGTPLDGAPFAGIKVVERRVDRLRRGVRGAAEIRPVSARWAWIEHALAQGGPDAGLALHAGWRAGGSFADYRRALRTTPIAAAAERGAVVTA